MSSTGEVATKTEVREFPKMPSSIEEVRNRYRLTFMIEKISSLVEDLRK